MFSIKNSFLIFVALILVGCASQSPFSSGDAVLDFTKVNYSANVIELDNHGTVAKEWYPVDGSICINPNTDELTFQDSATGGTIQLEGSYRLIKK